MNHTSHGRPALSTAVILQAAVRLADQEGVAGVTMRRLATELGVEAMSLYHYLPNKATLLVGMADTVVAEVNDAVAELSLAPQTTDWRADLRAMVLTSRRVLLRHPWSSTVIETRAALSPPVIAYHDTVVRLMLQGGLSHDLTHHALHALGSRAMGFSQELFAPGSPGADAATADAMPDLAATEYPHLTEMLSQVAHDPSEPTIGWCDDQSEFEFSLDLILAGLDRLSHSDAWTEPVGGDSS